MEPPFHTEFNLGRAMYLYHSPRLRAVPAGFQSPRHGPQNQPLQKPAVNSPRTTPSRAPRAAPVTSLLHMSGARSSSAPYPGSCPNWPNGERRRLDSQDGRDHEHPPGRRGARHTGASGGDQTRGAVPLDGSAPERARCPPAPSHGTQPPSQTCSIFWLVSHVLNWNFLSMNL